MFMLKDHNDTLYHCEIMVISTEMWVPNIPEWFTRIEHAEGYESVPVDPADFEGQTVLIRRGNSSFETTSNIGGSAAFIYPYNKQVENQASISDTLCRWFEGY